MKGAGDRGIDLLPFGYRDKDSVRGTRVARCRAQPAERSGAAVAVLSALFWLAFFLLPATAAERLVLHAPAELMQRQDLRGMLRPVVAPAGVRVLDLETDQGRMTLRLPRAYENATLWWTLALKTGKAGKEGHARRRLLHLSLGEAGVAAAGLSALALPPRITDVAASGGARIVEQTAHGLRLMAEPGSHAVVAILTDGPLSLPVTLRPLAERERQRLADMAFSGVLAGMTLLLLTAFGVLQILRPTPGAAGLILFVLGTLFFTFVNGGLIVSSFSGLVPAATLPRLELLAEGLLLSGLTLWLVHRPGSPLPRHPAVRYGLPGLAAGISAQALFIPDTGAVILRGALAAIVAAGLIGIWRGQRGNGGDPHRISMLLLAGWVAAAVPALAGALPPRTANLGLAAGLVVVSVSLATGMLQQIMSPGATLRRLLDDAGRRALALKAAGLAVWDLDVETGQLHVSEELSRLLGVPPEVLEGDAAGPFRQLMHPLDVTAYDAALKTLLQKGGRLSLPLRLRRLDGGYRWFLLEARALRRKNADAPPLRVTGVLMDVTAARRTEERLLSDAVRDRLTGLPNRALFMDRLARALARQEQQPRLAQHLFLLDIDRFRSINDAWGHEAGDAVLREIARRLGEFTGRTETLARLAGDQFALILDMAGSEIDPVTLARRMQRALGVPVETGRHDVRITATIGIAPLDTRCRSPEEMLRRAEIALFAAREEGPGQVALFRPSMLGERTRAVTLEQDLREALAHGRLEVVYQPIMDAESSAIAGFEALARWDHPELGPVSADAFVPLAEELGLIGELTEVVLEKAVRDLGVWQRAFRTAGSLYVAVNVTSLQLVNTDFVNQVATLLEREGIAPETLRLELTESAILEDPARGRRMVEALADMGVKVVCDDFGTGYSSLAIIRDLPFSTLKLDRSLLVAETDALRAAILLRSIVDMAHALDMEVVAEGIETEDQLALARDLGCDFVQGWHVGRPLSARRVTEILTKLALDVSGGAPLVRFRDFLDALGRRQSTGRRSSPETRQRQARAGNGSRSTPFGKEPGEEATPGSPPPAGG
jgi:diguanylate cyclase (GGDEF)-like protein